MPDKDAGTPRVFLTRHGETEWSQSGRYTGSSDIPLTPNGESQVRSTGGMLVGPNKLISPTKLAHVFISPRHRAHRTFDLLFADVKQEQEALVAEGKVSTTESLAEWGYGDYEGLLPNEIKALRKERGLDGERAWDIWKDGCERGESPEQVTKRVDEVIEEIRKLQQSSMHGEKAADVLLIAHGHFCRAFAKRWLNYPIEFPLSMMMEPGAVGVLTYQHHNMEEPAFLLGMGFPTTA